MANLPNPIQYHTYTGQHVPGAWPCAYLLAQNGLYKLADTPHFYASLQLASTRVAGLRGWPEKGRTAARAAYPRQMAGGGII